MRAKSKSVDRDVRYDPINPSLYPELGQDGDVIFYRFWCRPLYVVYEKYKHGVKLGYIIFPEGKEIFSFEQMVKYAESIKSGQTVCRVRS